MAEQYIKTSECEFKKLEDTQQESIVYKVLYELSHSLANNEIYLSEADLQFSFAQKVDELGAENIILEYPIMANDLYHDSNRDEREFLDLYFSYNGQEYFVEFKYKLEDIKDNNKVDVDVKRHENNFTIKKQGAENNCRFLVYEDIQRMENIKKNQNDKFKSYVIFITNDSAYWRLNGDEKGEQRTKYSDFYLGAKNQYRKQNKNKSKTNKGELTYNVEKEKKLKLDNSYPIIWYNFKKIFEKQKKVAINGAFKALVIDLQKEQM